MFKFRYTLLDESADAAVLEWVKKVSPCHFVVQHDADAEVKATHWHASLRPAIKEAGLRKSFKLANGVVPPANWSLGTVKDGEGDVYERYMCHAGSLGDPVKIIQAQGLQYTQSWADSQNKAFYAAQAAFGARIKAKAKGNTIEELLDEAKAKQATKRDEVTLLCIDMFRRQRRAMVENYMKAVITAVCVEMDIEKATRSLADRLNYFPQY